MTRVRSSPVRVSVDSPGRGPGATSLRVVTPSNSTCGVPLTVSTATTRSSGVCPAATRKTVCSGERLLSVNLSWKPLRAPAAVVAWTLVSASTTAFGTGTGTTGPASSVR